MEKIFNYLILLTNSIFTLLKVLIRSSLFIKTPLYKEDKCIILGNGPHLKKVLASEMSLLKSHHLFCVNNFPNTPQFEVCKPSNFIICSHEFFNNKKTIDPNTLLRKQIIASLIEKTTWPLNVFLPIAAKKNKPFVKNIRSNTCIKVYFFNDTPVEGVPMINHFFFRRNLGMPRPHNVLIPSILLSINCGFKEVYLVGADHSWLPLIKVNEQNEALIGQKHFYDEKEVKKEVMYKGGLKPRRLHEILEKFLYAFRSYFELKDYAEKQGVKIINSTEGSFIDAYTRKPLSSILEETSL